MVKVRFTLSDDGHYTYLKISGHANYAELGEDLVCAAVSSIGFGLMNALDENDIEGVTIKDQSDAIEIINESSSAKVDDFMELVIFQLKTIEESYGKFIKTERK